MAILDMDKLVNVRNRNNGSTGYVISDGGMKISRTWEKVGEVKKISADELQKVMWSSGGDYILKNLLVIEDKDVLNALNIETEPEYFYSEADIRNLLSNNSATALDELRDFFDFAPEGAKQMAKDIAIKERIPDTNKREIISKATGFNIQNAINIQDELKRQEQEALAEQAKQEATKIVADQIIANAAKPVEKTRRVSTSTTNTTEKIVERRVAK